MSGLPGSRTEAAPSLPCKTILYRLLTRASWIDPERRRVLPAAFLRRAADAGLSVFIKDRCPIEQARQRLQGVKAVASLHTGRIRDVDQSLDVVPDAEDATHAEIIGLPLQSEDLARAIYLAELLAEQARIA